MKYTNKYNCEPCFVRAVESDDYDKGDADFSITELIAPARQRSLIDKLKDTLEVDVSTRIAAERGKAWHAWMKRGVRDIDIYETRYYANFGNYRVSAQIDLLYGDTRRLIDWKTTKCYPFTGKGGGGHKPEYEAQLNGQLEILTQNNVKVESIHVVGVFGDHNKNCLDKSSRFFTPKYPACEMMTVDLEMWPREKTVAWIKERIREHFMARKDENFKCSSEETWGGNRCKSYCDVSSHCNQWKKAQQTGIMEE